SGAALASALVVYGIAATYFITVGIGSIRGRRWARAFSIVVGALWAIGGVVGGLMMIVVLPRALAAFGSGNNAMIAGCAALGTLIVGIALPLVIHLFYRRQDVRLTFERLDPKPRWTDRVPLPVLAIVVVLAFGAVALVANLGNPSFSLFGRRITGAPAALTLFAFAGLSGFLAVQLYRLKESAWWTLILLQIAGIAFAVISMATTDLAAANPELPREVAEVYRDPWFLAIVAATWISYFAFLLYLRRFFVLNLAPRTRRSDQSTFSS
ncbi:MAG TPA: hypothetical protein VFT12_08445, partial [Thermoanaerobaculia bacterium]|nr:hypothetical protein [Thermoanaerobaculia bacterium]